MDSEGMEGVFMSRHSDSENRLQCEGTGPRPAVRIRTCPLAPQSLSFPLVKEGYSFPAHTPGRIRGGAICGKQSRAGIQQELGKC